LEDVIALLTSNMVARVLLLVTLIALLFATIACADDAPKLPSRKASFVLPLLKAFDAKEGFARIKTILGHEDIDVGNGIMDCTYGLDDRTTIRVQADPDGVQVLSISRQMSAKPGDTQVIYALSKAWEH
jgi:hypothetical protein